MVEAMANGVEDKLIDGLSFKMQPGQAMSLREKALRTTLGDPTSTRRM